MLTALTRDVSPAMDSCELTYLTRKKIDIAKAIEQHICYRQALFNLGVRVIELPAEAALPDSVFVEDPVLVLDELAVIARTGAESRRNEAEMIATALAPFRRLEYITAPGTLEGGDVMRIERDLFVGLSPRSNQDGVAQLARIVEPFGYDVHAVGLRHCLHLKTACSYLGEETILLNRAWVDSAPLTRWKLLDVAEGERWAANALRVRDTVLFPASFPKTQELLTSAGFQVQPLELSELQKAEGSVTCMSVIFESEPAESNS
jgi:dimethylargininase